MKTKLAFGVGAIGEAGPYIAFQSFNMIFYNVVLGLPGSLCGLAVFLALVFDAIADPVIGFWSDRVRTRLGRRHPFMYAAPIPLALSFYCIYSPPEGLSQMGLFAWLMTFTLLMRQAISLFHVPHLALGAELTPDYQQRSVVMSYNVIFQVVGGAGAAYLGWTWFGSTAGGTTVRENFAPLGLWVAVVAAVAVFVSTHFTRDQIPKLRMPPAQGPANMKSFLEAIGDCLKNGNYRVLLLGLLFLSATIGVRETLSSHMNLFFWELPENKIRNFALASPPAYILAFIFTARLHHRLEKRTTVIFAMCVLMFAAVTPLTLRLLGMFPENGSPKLLPTLMLFHFIFYLGMAILTISVLSALADIADEHELNTRRRQEGMFYAARTFFAQMTNGLGHLIAGVALDLIKFPTGAKPGQIDADVLLALGWIEGPIAALPGLLAIAFYARFKIDRQRLAEIQTELAARRREPVDHPPESQPAAAVSEAMGSV